MGINEFFFIDNQIIFKKNFVDQCASFIESGFGGWTRELLLCSYEVVCSLSKLGSVLSGFGIRLLRVTCAITFVLNNIRLLIFCYYFTLPISISILFFSSSFTFLKRVPILQRRRIVLLILHHPSFITCIYLLSTQLVLGKAV